MTEDQLQTALKSLGMTAFVTHLALFKSHLSATEAAAVLQSRTGWASKASLTRVNNARRILAQGHEKDALRLIIASRLPAAVQEAARLAL
jgi:hypothetical protein